MNLYPIKILIVGGGSIGQRHLRNAKELGVKEIFVAEPNKEKQDKLRQNYGIYVYNDYKEALHENWTAVFICTPPVNHIEIASKFADKRIPLFIEKPLSCDLRNVATFIRKAKRGTIPVMVGYNLRFHPQLRQIREILRKGILGKVWGVRVDAGQYLPDWHPWEDYRTGYSAQRRFGGGVILDGIHEIDYLFWFFGDVQKMVGLTKRVGNLKIDTEDYAEITLVFQNGVIGQIHIDYLQRFPSRTLKIIGEKGTLICDIRNSELKYFFAKDKLWHVQKLKKFDFNQTYREELKYFFTCITSKKMPFESDLVNGYKTLRIALNAKKL